ncbi:hypothetical protein HYALB_00013747 [Hymenoscyphus albidus]|uniref:Peptide hydrolase n=1 Tax=Hymenoscyphus albidus TaxID=595503 RepID=A0A9N9QAL6_9HELO|nr:hypothetical protein HYALB_00013747 [Hymenoscyphus albidus]
MKFIQSFSLGAACLSVSAVATPPSEPEFVTSERLQNDITEEGLMGSLKRLEDIAYANGGNRAFGFPGYDASVDFIVERLEKLSETTTFFLQDVPGLFTQVASISFAAGGESIPVIGLTYSPSTSAEGLTLPLAHGPTGDVGCTVEGYSGLNVTGKIVLVERGTCPTGGTLAGRLLPAAAAGAAAVIIYNNVNASVTGGTLSAPNPAQFVPGGFINRSDGLALVQRLSANETIIASFQQTQLIENKITRNVIAETKGGDPNNVIMIGAHLDSVQAGPGINDDGSGTSLILELFTALNSYQTKNKVRAGWWAAEENGLVGSRYYTAQLDATNVTNLLAYLNFDMVSKGFFGVFDGDGSSHGLAGPAGSDVIEKMFVDDLTSKGLNVTPAIFSGGSDYVSFMENLKKPIGGLFTGTGVEQDPCYHRACDNFENPNATVITINAKTAAHVLANLAIDGATLLPKAAESSNIGRIGEMPIQWTSGEGLEGQDSHTGTCGHDV